MTHSFPTGSSSDLLLRTRGVAGRDAEPLAGAAGPIPVPASPWRDLGEAASSVWVTPHLLAAMCLAFLINLTAFPLSGGLLPYVAKEIYGVDQTWLGYLARVPGGRFRVRRAGRLDHPDPEPGRHPSGADDGRFRQIGRTSCRERGCRSVWLEGGTVALK